MKSWFWQPRPRATLIAVTKDWDARKKVKNDGAKYVSKGTDGSLSIGYL